jgi:type IV pilus assembly protein PilF
VNQGLRLLMIALVPLVLLQGCTPVQSTRTTDEMGELGEEAGDPSAADVYVKLAVAYMREGQMEQALKKAKRGVRLDPNSPSANNVIALLYERLGDNELAERHYKRAVRLDPKDPYIRNAYGSFLCAQERYEEADQEYVQALRNPLYKTPEVALTNAGICAGRSNKVELAESHFRRALQANPRFPLPLVHMAQISLDKGNYLSSRGYLQRYLEVAKHSARTLWLGIQAERELGDLDAVASYELLLRGKFPDSEEMKLMEASHQQ